MKTKEKQGRKLKNKDKLIGITSIAAALVIAVILLLVTTVKANEPVDIIAVKTDIAQGKQLTEEDIQTVTVSKYNLPESVINNKDSVLGKYATIPMKSGDYIFPSKLSASALGTDTQFADLEDGQLAVSFTVKSQAAGVANKLQAGDVIRLYSYDQIGGVKDYPELSFVQVISVSDSNGLEVNGGSNVSDTTYSSITIKATPEQAKRLIELENTTSIHVSFLTRNAETAQLLLDKQNAILG